MALGLGREAVRYRVKVGRLIPAYHGVYAVGHLPAGWIDRAAGALLACGGKALLSHDSAAMLWGWVTPWREPFHVTVPTSHSRAGIVVHRAKLTRADRRSQRGLPVTSPARTLLDVAPGLDRRPLRRLVNDAQHRYVRLHQLAEVIERFPRHPGARLLRPFVEHSRGPTRSDFEDVFLEFCERFGLPQPVINARVGGYELDAYFPQHRLAVELDSWEWHKDRDTFESDREKDAHLLSMHINTVRITWERLVETPEREAARLLAIMRRAA